VAYEGFQALPVDFVGMRAFLAPRWRATIAPMAALGTNAPWRPHLPNGPRGLADDAAVGTVRP
jgi:hypothetical protein